jgi:peptidoglycan/LPS O-acetylase OafA/YrhL
LAIFFVLMNHVHMRLFLAKVPCTTGLPEQLISSLVWNGQFGVQLFFTVSGFLITTTSLSRWGALPALDIRGFYALRFARIAPLLLLLLATLSILHLANVPNFVVSPRVGGLSNALFAALTFQVNVLEATRGYLPANWDILWSLSVEEMFYLFFPLACRLLKPEKRFLSALFLFVALGPMARTIFAQGNEVWKEYSYLGSMDAIALGCLIALLASRIRFSSKTLLTFTITGLSWMSFILLFSIQAEKWGLHRLGLDMTILAIGACLLMIVAAQTCWQAPWLLHPLLAMGQRSYEIYLTHMFVIFALFELFQQTGSHPNTVPILFPATLFFATLAGALVARYFTEPLNRRLRLHFTSRTTE